MLVKERKIVMKTKKIMSLVLALIMALSLAVPAFATTTALDNTNIEAMDKINTGVTTINGTYQAPILALTVPKKINTLLNPYGVAVTINSDTAIETDDVQRQISSADNLIISRSNVPLGIKATVTATIASAEGGAWTLAQTNLATDSVKKEAFIYMLFGDVDTSAIDTAAEVTDFMLTAPASGKSPYEGLNATDINYATVDPGNTNIQAPTAATDTRDGIILKAGEGKETTLNQTLGQCDVDTSGTTPVYNSVSAVAFKLEGEMNANPKDSSWGKDDKLTVSVAWKFVPGSQASISGNNNTPATPDINITANTVTTATVAKNYNTSSDTTLALTMALPTGVTGAAVTGNQISLTPSGGTNTSATNVTITVTDTSITLDETTLKAALGTNSTGATATFAVTYNDGAAQTCNVTLNLTVANS